MMGQTKSQEREIPVICDDYTECIGVTVIKTALKLWNNPRV